LRPWRGCRKFSGGVARSSQLFSKGVGPSPSINYAQWYPYRSFILLEMNNGSRTVLTSASSCKSICDSKITFFASNGQLVSIGDVLLVNLSGNGAMMEHLFINYCHRWFLKLCLITILFKILIQICKLKSYDSIHFSDKTNHNKIQSI
jgi:hypothetical protein